MVQSSKKIFLRKFKERLLVKEAAEERERWKKSLGREGYGAETGLRALFLQFVWARSRLPLVPSAMTMQFKLQQAPDSDRPDDHLPSAHTCFFTLVELESAYARRLAEGVLTESSLSQLRLKARELESALGLIWPDAEVLEDARRLVPELGLRPADALQLACARLVARGRPGLRFASLDERLNEAARAVGLSMAW